MDDRWRLPQPSSDSFGPPSMQPWRRRSTCGCCQLCHQLRTYGRQLRDAQAGAAGPPGRAVYSRFGYLADERQDDACSSERGAGGGEAVGDGQVGHHRDGPRGFAQGAGPQRRHRDVFARSGALPEGKLPYARWYGGCPGRCHGLVGRRQCGGRGPSGRVRWPPGCVAACLVDRARGDRYRRVRDLAGGRVAGPLRRAEGG
jgi:hypothetical protein